MNTAIKGVVELIFPSSIEVRSEMGNKINCPNNCDFDIGEYVWLIDIGGKYIAEKIDCSEGEVAPLPLGVLKVDEVS